MDEPGGLRDLDETGRAAWEEAVMRCLRAASPAGGHPFVIPVADERTAQVTGPDWTGLPVRVVDCLTRARALPLLDSDRRLQEEYVEWRTVRDRGGAIRRVELTTELRDYWRVLAAHEPERTVELVGELTGRAVRPRDVYGISAPAGRDPAEREKAFAATMVARPNPLNDGRSGICFMSHRGNDLRSLVTLVAVAAIPCVVRDAAGGRARCATASEAIPLLGRAAVAGRASDPVIVERVGRLAFERRLVAFDDPVGVYIQGVEHTRLRTPDGSPLPPEWFAASRGTSAGASPDGRARHQRLVLEVPAGEGFAVSDLVDVATERPIGHGAQVAELVQLRALLRMSAPGVAPAHAALEARPRVRRAVPCRDVRELAARR
jgi:hypothetical protein